jgi:hypothetical protein
MTDDRRPTTDDRRPTTDDRRPTTDDRRPTTDQSVDQRRRTKDGGQGRTTVMGRSMLRPYRLLAFGVGYRPA